jgi:hypothetical protein
MTDEYWEVENFSRYGYDKCLAPGGASIDSGLHFAQLLRGEKKTEVFRKFDWGSKSLNKQQ